MKFFEAASLFVAMGSLTASCKANEDLKKETIAALVNEVDRIPRPIPEKMLKEFYPESVEGDFIVSLGPEIFQNEELKKGCRATLVGTKQKPIAIIFYIQSKVSCYIVPFKGVIKLDRSRRLLKIDERFYRIESNRSSSGVVTQEIK